MRIKNHHVIGATAACIAAVFAAPVNAQEAAPATERSAQSYAKAFNVSAEEAGHRLVRQHSIGELNAKLEAGEADTFGGLYIDNTPTYRVVAKFTANGAATLSKYTQDPTVVAEVAPVSYKQLATTQTEVYQLLKGLGIESASQVNIRTSKVEFFVADPAALQALVTAGTLKLPNFVTIGKAARPLANFGEAKVEGGRPLSGGSCTLGFTTSRAELAI